MELHSVSPYNSCPMLEERRLPGSFPEGGHKGTNAVWAAETVRESNGSC